MTYKKTAVKPSFSPSAKRTTSKKAEKKTAKEQISLTTVPAHTAHAEQHDPMSSLLSEEEKEKWRNLVEGISDKSINLWQLYCERMLSGSTADGPTVLAPWIIADTILKASGQLLENPEQLFRSQQTLLTHHTLLGQQFAARNTGEEPQEYISPEPKDKRFKHDDWQKNPYFNYIKQAYLVNSHWLQNMVNNIDGLDHKTAQKMSFYTKQWLDALSPTNFPHTNPEVINRTLESKGENLLQGMHNLLNDLERGNGKLSIPKTNLTHFKIGENIATTPGKVIYQNEIMQLIHYEPTQAQSHAIPLLIIPPWINKFYVFDLSKNSFVKYALELGHSVFIISWINPDSSLAHKTFADYMLEGPITALEQTLKATGAAQANLMSYCLGGILMSCTLGYLAAHNDKRVASATFCATLVDFTESGDLSVFIDDEQLDLLEARTKERGFLDSYTMAESFNLLRANSLIWNAYINNYLLSKEFAPFDMLFWNSDSTRMPPQVHSYYIRNLYQKNLLIKEGELILNNTPINLKKVTVPCFFLSAIDDHIAPWQCAVSAHKIFGGDVKFVLSGSGHVAGVFNSPEQNKYCYWLNDKNHSNTTAWFETAEQHTGSWWPVWKNWIVSHAGPKIASIKPSTRTPAIENAPGSYVMVSDIY